MHMGLIQVDELPMIAPDMHDHAFADALGADVRQRRRALGLKQVDLAELAGCSTRFVHAVEAGKPTLRLDSLLDVLRVLGLSLRLERFDGGDVPPRGSA